MLPRLLDYIRKRRRTFEVPMPKINALRFAMIGASTGRGRDRPKANLRKFRGYSNDCQNQKYEAISGGFLAGGPGFEPRLTESESAVLPLNYPPQRPQRDACEAHLADLTRGYLKGPP